MIKNYIKTAWRSLWNNKVYTTINITGLSIGLTVFVLVLLYVNREQSYDRWDKQLERVYRVIIEEDEMEEKHLSPFVPPAMGYFMQQQLPEVEKTTTFQERSETAVYVGNEAFYDRQIIMADSSFFTVFPYRFAHGHPQSALSAPQSVVISQEMSKKWFGDENPIGKTLAIGAQGNTYTITGVFEKTAPSHLDFNMCVSTSFDETNWRARIANTYALIKEKASLSALTPKLTDNFVLNHALGRQGTNPSEERITTVDDARQWLKKHYQTEHIEVSLEQVEGIHLRPKAYGWADAPSNHPVNDYEKGNHIPVLVFSFIAGLVLLLACINYSNMAIAIGNTKAKESGLRKIIGANRGQLIFQFLLESMIQVFIALVLGLFMSYMMIQYLNNTFGMELQLWSEINPVANKQLILQLLFITIGVSFLSGFYPSMLLSSFKPVQLVRGEVGRGVKGLRLRNVLVVAQFTIAVVFIASLFVMQRQVNFMQHHDPGFESAQVMRINGERFPLNFFESLDKHEFLMNSIRNLSEVGSVATTHFYPGKPSHSVQSARFGHQDSLSVNANWVGLGYFQTLGMDIMAGRDFSIHHSQDTIDAAIINETAARMMGIDHPMGERIEVLGMAYTVIGVVKDTHMAGYTTAIGPDIYVIGTRPYTTSGRRQLMVKIRDGHSAQVALKKIQSIWKEVDGSAPMRYSWLDNDFAQLMEKYERFGKLTGLLTIAALAIAIMGMFALSAFAAQQRTKEIGIRKVLGASISGIVGLLSKDFVKLVLIAILIASPLAWWAMSKWLEDFAYKIEIQWWMFALAGLGAVIIALLTVSFQAIKAAVANPVDSLRDE